MIGNNYLKEKMQKGVPVLGTWNTVGSPLVTEIIASSGLDFLIVDFEHGPFQIERVQEYVNRCEPYACTPIIRICG